MALKKPHMISNLIGKPGGGTVLPLSYSRCPSATSHVRASARERAGSRGAGWLLAVFPPFSFFSRVEWDSVHEGSLSWKLLERESETMGLAREVLALPFASSVITFASNVTWPLLFCPCVSFWVVSVMKSSASQTFSSALSCDTFMGPHRAAGDTGK